MKKLILLFILIGFSANSIAQNYGVVGKRGVLKTDIVNYITARGGNVELEYAIAKQFSLSFEYKFNKQKLKPIYNDFFSEESRNITSGYDENYGVLAGEKFDMASHYFNLGIRFYKHNKFNAPKGQFYYAKIGYSISEVEGYYPRIVEDVLGQTSTEYFRFREKGIHHIPIEIGLGKQWVFAQWITLEVSGGYFLAYNINDGGVQLSEGVVNRINPGLVPLSGRYILSNDYSNFAHGLSFSIKLGIMTPF